MFAKVPRVFVFHGNLPEIQRLFTSNRRRNRLSSIENELDTCNLRPIAELHLTDLWASSNFIRKIVPYGGNQNHFLSPPGATCICYDWYILTIEYQIVYQFVFRPRGLMVKALVFGTKDLCVRIAPWSIHFGNTIVIIFCQF